MEFREAKQVIRDFMRTHYTDERLAMLLAHAQNGQLAFNSCCCFVGVTSAQHKLISTWPVFVGGVYVSHGGPTYTGIAGGREASIAYRCLMHGTQTGSFAGLDRNDPQRQRILIPMIKAEMRRREKLRGAVQIPATRDIETCVSY